MDRDDSNALFLDFRGSANNPNRVGTRHGEQNGTLVTVMATASAMLAEIGTPSKNGKEGAAFSTACRRSSDAVSAYLDRVADRAASAVSMSSRF